MALATAQDLIDSSLRLLGVVDQEGTPTTTQRNQGLDALNAIIDSLMSDGMLHYRHDDELITVSGASMTWGSGGDINTTRPAEVIAARVVETDLTEYSIKVLPPHEYRQYYNKATTGTITAVSYDPTVPLGTLYFVGATSGTIKLTTLKPWTQYALLSTSLGLPPGYVRYMRHTLAIELSPEYPGTQPSPVSVSIAENMRVNLARINAHTKAQRIQNAYTTAAFNAHSGDTGYIYEAG